jgi:hypothetical protein
MAVAMLLGIAALAMATGKAYVQQQRFDLAVSDGRYYYVYLPSLFADGDLDFSNQIQQHWGPDYSPGLLEERTPIGLVRNKYPIGLALTFLPAFSLGYLLSLLFGLPADGYAWPCQLACLITVEFLVWRTFVRIDRLLVDHLQVPALPSVMAIVLYALGTPYLYYTCREPFMVHAVSTFWCTEAIYVAITATAKPWRFWPWLVFCTSMAIVCRPTNVHILPVVLMGIVTDWKSVLRDNGLYSLLVSALCAFPVVLQLVTWKQLTGSWLSYSYTGETFDWTHPELVKTLFSSRHGLFFWSPVLLLSMWGLICWNGGHSPPYRKIVLPWLLGGLLLWYANSAWHCWWFGDAFGGRAFLELSGLLCIGLALAFARIPPWSRLAICVLSLAFHAGLMALYITRKIPRGDSLINGW